MGKVLLRSVVVEALGAEALNEIGKKRPRLVFVRVLGEAFWDL